MPAGPTPPITARVNGDAESLGLQVLATGYGATMPDDPSDPTGNESPDDTSPDASSDTEHRDEALDRGDVDHDSPGRSLIGDGDEIVEPNEPA